MTDDRLGQAVVLLMQYARAQERIRAALGDVRRLVEGLGDVVALDRELAPEIEAALDLVTPLSEALERAGNFLDARLDARAHDLMRAEREGG